MEIEPLSFCSAKRPDSDRLLVVIRNEDISSHIHKVRPETTVFFLLISYQNLGTPFGTREYQGPFYGFLTFALTIPVNSVVTPCGHAVIYTGRALLLEDLLKTALFKITKRVSSAFPVPF